MIAAAWTSPIPVSWPTVVVLTLNLCVCTYLLGRNKMTEYQDSRIEWVVGENGRLRTALRMLYAATEFEWPDLEHDAEPEDKPRWYRRAWAWLNYQKPAATPQPVDEAEAVQVSGVELDPETEHSGLAEPEAPNFVVDPNPSTAPIPPLPGPATVPDLKAAAQVAPLAAISYEDWKADFDARVERDMAVIRGTE